MWPFDRAKKRRQEEARKADAVMTDPANLLSPVNPASPLWIGSAVDSAPLDPGPSFDSGASFSVGDGGGFSGGGDGGAGGGGW